ncbi:Metallo-dependent phosphatase-like protein [Fomitopsis serialis]|uniref:Metallo-dependent phosphatase-like protein n=1 Tax=Fomitopsis serialis TaxID=139415 RepID=UPI002008D2AD|nr:Metallo-dependent phosphatase-like protein [Neoantrodia serialis]KAH9930037.1 Metallo-dependent phosphatase-like protein [Neoantrodia serialis]
MSSSKRPRDGASHWQRRAYPVAALALSSIFLVGLAMRFDFLSSGHLPDFIHKKSLGIDFPDFNKVTQVYTLSEGELGLNDPSRRVLLIGDLHGMNKSLHNLLSATSYDPASDTIILAGDTMAKTTLSGSLAILDFITQHKCGEAPGPLYAVRGNHDQTIVQWRAWRDWFEPLQLSIPSAPAFTEVGAELDLHPDAHPGRPVKTGRQFLELIEREWQRDVRRDPKGSADPEEWADVARKRAVGTWREEWWRRVPRPGKGHQNKDWPIFDDHYWLAREMTPVQKACLYSLPLVLHVPSEHFFVVHAGILPYDPKRPLTDRHQPLAHPPRLTHTVTGPDEGHYAVGTSSSVSQSALASALVEDALKKKNDTQEQLRTLQERALLKDIPGNRDPWVLLNMRGIRKKKRKVTRDNNKGTPWSKVWNEQMGLCNGFDSALPSDASPPHPRSIRSLRGSDPEAEALPCEPATVVYGHAATRSLDVKRWSMGIDTGCVYGRRLTSLVLQRSNGSTALSLLGHGDEDEDDFDTPPLRNSDVLLLREEPDLPHKRWKTKAKKVQFGDDAGIDAQLVSVRCPDMGDLL